MTNPHEGGSYIKQPDGSLVRAPIDKPKDTNAAAPASPETADANDQPASGKQKAKKD